MFHALNCWTLVLYTIDCQILNIKIVILQSVFWLIFGANWNKFGSLTWNHRNMFCNELCVLRTSQINNCAWKNKVESSDVLNKLASSAALCMSKTLMWGAISIQPLFAKVEITVEFGPVAKTLIYFHERITARTSAAIRYKIMPPWCGLGDNQQSIKCKIYINLIL